MISYFDKKYNCTVIELIEEKITMYLGERLLTKNPNGNGEVIEVFIVKLFDLEWANNSEDILVQDLNGNQFMVKAWLVRPIEKTELKELNPEEIKTTELPIEKLTEEREVLDD